MQAIVVPQNLTTTYSPFMVFATVEGYWSYPSAIGAHWYSFFELYGYEKNCDYLLE